MTGEIKRAIWKTIPIFQRRQRDATWRRDKGRAVLVELLRTNNLVLISFIEAILKSEGIGCFIADQHMSAMEGSLGFLPRRILVMQDEEADARQLLSDAGLNDNRTRVALPRSEGLFGWKRA